MFEGGKTIRQCRTDEMNRLKVLYFDTQDDAYRIKASELLKISDEQLLAQAKQMGYQTRGCSCQAGKVMLL